MPPVEHLTGNRNRLRDSQNELRRFRPDCVIDTIASDEGQARAVNEVFRGSANRVVVLSSGDVYRAWEVLSRMRFGPPEPIPLREDDPLRDHLYIHGESQFEPDLWVSPQYEKILVERAVMNHPDLPATVLRLPMTYGPNDSAHRFYPYLKRMDEARASILLDRPTAQWRAPWGYVENVAEAVILACESSDAAGRVYNVCNRESLTLAEFVRRLGSTAGWRGKIVVSDRPCPPPSMSRQFNLEQHLFMDSTRIRSELGYTEPVTFEEGLRRMVAWERTMPPETIDASMYDYAAEDETLNKCSSASSAETY